MKFFNLKIKYLILIILLCLINIKITYAVTLIQEKEDNVWIFRKGGGLASFSSKFTSYYFNDLVAYCIEPGAHITTDEYIENEGIINSPFSSEVNKRLQLISYYGYDYPGHKTLRYRMATQALIWDEVFNYNGHPGVKVEYWTEKSGGGTYISVEEEKSIILDLVNKHSITPSFINNSYTGILNDTLTLVDNNNVLNNYEVLNNNSYIDNNKLVINLNSIGNNIITLKRKKYSNNTSKIFFGIDNESQTMGYFNLDEDEYINVFTNTLGGSIKVNKLDQDTLSTTPSGDASLDGAIYGIYDNNDIKLDEIIIKNNTAKSNNILGIGHYYIKEIKAGNGYNLDNNKYYFDITSNNLEYEITLYNNVIKGYFEIYKVLNNISTGILTPEENVTFNIYSKSDNSLISSITTDNEGYCNILLPYGKYIIEQVTTSYKYDKIDNFEINITSSEKITKIIADGIKTSKLKLIKIDADTEELLNISGIKFKIKNTDTNTYVCQINNYPNHEELCEYEITNGYFVTPDVLEYGNYEIEEVPDSVISNYLWNNEKISFSINDDTIEKIDGDNYVIIYFPNKKVLGSIVINKYGEHINYEDNSINYYYDNYYEAEFNLIANEDIYSNNKLIYKKDDIIKTFVTNKKNYTINNLLLGSYCLVETYTDNNYILDSKHNCFTLDYIDQYTDIVIKNIDIYNYLKKGTFELHKVDSYNNPIANVLFTFYDINNKIISIQKTDDLGTIRLENIPLGLYYYIENETPDGYILNNNINYFELKYNDQKEINTLVNENLIIDVPNTLDNNYYYIVIIINGLYLLYDKKKYII